MNQAEFRDIEVAIVGCGPAGASMALALARQGHRVVVIDRLPDVLQIPRAIHIDGETMRIFQQLGVAADLMPHVRAGSKMTWLSASGDVLLERMGTAGVGDQGWHGDYYFHQPHLETALRSAFGRYPNLRFLPGTDVLAVTEEGDRVRLQWRNESSGETGSLSAAYLVGADGARSFVREALGAGAFEDLGEHQGWLVVDANLHRPLNLPEHSIQHCDPARPATSIYINPLRRRWELMVLPTDDLARLTDEDHVWQLLSPWIKPWQGTLERAATYVFHSLIARKWQTERVFLIGDAAHQTPPFLGQGLCAALRDVANLAWKLSFVLSGRAGASLLATYDAERIPHVREFIQLAVDVGQVIQITDPAEAARRDERLKRESLKFAVPKPCLGPGLHRGSGEEADERGRIFPQLDLKDGRSMDALAAAGFLLLLERDFDATALQNLTPMLMELGIASGWMERAGQGAILLRPDLYVYDIFSDGAALARALPQLAQALR
ncbi:MAG: bifunctional 3-(3-hydroxy-phenyl)propionate/3-hydroxycinnamic acid hydroxylase [Zoogloea sp.]|uniref:bifunctional 3-(3-hydroxy-phenyl)propionate/3-hydroxycinnamic acid hydroxylase n=1 Tax=Zoogloea sp. TaxID=49181 RepID=UPI003F40DE39